MGWIRSLGTQKLPGALPLTLRKSQQVAVAFGLISPHSSLEQGLWGQTLPIAVSHPCLDGEEKRISNTKMPCKKELSTKGRIDYWGWGEVLGLIHFKSILGMANVIIMYSEEGSHANNKNKLLENEWELWTGNVWIIASKEMTCLIFFSCVHIYLSNL